MTESTPQSRATIAPLAKANAARLNAALNKPYRFSHGIDTLGAMIERGAFARAEIGQVPSVVWNRRKFNRMDAREQADYQRKLDTMKPEYRLFNAGCPHGSWITVPKMIFDFAQARLRGRASETCLSSQQEE